MKILKTLFGYWKRFALALGWVNTRILLFVFFCLIIGPTSLIGRLLGKNFFEDKLSTANSFWHQREETVATKESCYRQF